MKAFPQLAHWDIDERNGMDLRDYFAAKAMQALITSRHMSSWYTIDSIVDLSYKYTDAMMEARNK